MLRAVRESSTHHGPRKEARGSGLWTAYRRGSTLPHPSTMRRRHYSLVSLANKWTDIPSQTKSSVAFQTVPAIDWRKDDYKKLFWLDY